MDADAIAVTGNAGSINVGGAINGGSIAIGGSLGILSVGGAINSGPITVGGSLGTLSVGDAINNGPITVIGSLTALNVAGSVATPIHVGANLGSMNIAGSLASEMTMGGSAGVMTIGGDVLSPIAMGAASNSLTVSGSVMAPISVAGNLNTLHVGGNLAALTDVHGNLQTLTVGGDVTAAVTITGNLSSATINGSLAAPLIVGGNAGPITIGHDLAAGISIGGKLESISVGGSTTATVSVSGNLGAISVTGNLSAPMSIAGNLTSISVTGSLAAAVSVAGDLGSISVGHDLNAPVAIAGSLSNLSIGGSLNADVSAQARIDSATIGGGVSAALAAATSIGSITIAGNLEAGGTISAGARLASLIISGAAAGKIVAASVGTIAVATATPDANTHVALAVTQAGITRQIEAEPLGDSIAGVTMKVLYDGASNPRASVRLSNATGTRFDLILDAPPAARFDLGRLDTAEGASSGIRNISITGSLARGVTPAEQANFGYTPDVTSSKPAKKKVKAAAKVAGGIILPSDALGTVAASYDIQTGSIRAASVQGVAFATVTDTAGHISLASDAVKSRRGVKAKLLQSVLAVNAATKKPYTAILPAAEPIQLTVSAASRIGLFEGTTGKAFDPRGILLWDNLADGSKVTATVSFDISTKTPTVQSLHFDGSGGSVDTYLTVNSISQTGEAGTVLLRSIKTGKH
jgi:hypothetical protein